MTFSIIVAADKNDVIGALSYGKHIIPWKNKTDMDFFKSTTLNSNVIMGRNTFVSIGKPLKDRLNIVITSNTELQERTDIITFNTLDDALSYTETTPRKTFVIGGSMLYREALTKATLDSLYYNIVPYESNYESYIKFPWSIHDILGHFDTETSYVNNEVTMIKFSKLLK